MKRLVKTNARSVVTWYERDIYGSYTKRKENHWKRCIGGAGETPVEICPYRKETQLRNTRHRRWGKSLTDDDGPGVEHALRETSTRAAWYTNWKRDGRNNTALGETTSQFVCRTNGKRRRSLELRPTDINGQWPFDVDTCKSPVCLRVKKQKQNLL